jgi:hypothetical protein
MKSVTSLACIVIMAMIGCKTPNSESQTLSAPIATSVPSGLAVTSEKIFRTNLEDQIANFEKGGVDNPISLFCQTLGLLYLTKAEFSGDAPEPWLEKALKVSETCPQQDGGLLMLTTRIKLKLHKPITEQEFAKILEQAAGNGIIKTDIRDLQLEYYAANNKVDLAKGILESQPGKDTRTNNWILLGRIQSESGELEKGQASFQKALETILDPNPWVVAYILQASADNYFHQAKKFPKDSTESNAHMKSARENIELSLKYNPNSRHTKNLITEINEYF